MLVLSRQREQRILLGDDIRITVVAIEGGRVRIGVEAPPRVVILRGELDDRVRERGLASQGRGDRPNTPDRPID
jgi:carbon storage regulator